MTLLSLGPPKSKVNRSRIVPQIPSASVLRPGECPNPLERSHQHPGALATKATCSCHTTWNTMICRQPLKYHEVPPCLLHSSRFQELLKSVAYGGWSVDRFAVAHIKQLSNKPSFTTQQQCSNPQIIRNCSACSPHKLCACHICIPSLPTSTPLIDVSHRNGTSYHTCISCFISHVLVHIRSVSRSLTGFVFLVLWLRHA